MQMHRNCATTARYCWKDRSPNMMRWPMKPRNTRRRRAWAACAGLVSLFVAAVAPLQVRAESGLSVELNKLESVENACRVYMVFANETDRAFEAFKLDLVAFDPEGVITERLALEAGPLPRGKTSVKLFDFQDSKCADVDRILLNEVMTCRTAEGAEPECTRMVETRSKASAEFFK